MIAITEMRIGGASLTALETARALRDEFVFSFVCGRTPAPDSVLREAAAEFPLLQLPALVRPLSPHKDAQALRDVRRLIREQQPAIVHTHSSKAGIIARVAARGTGCAVVHSIHGWGHTPADRTARRWILVTAERIGARWCDSLVAVSSDVRDEGLRLGIGRPSQYTVIPGFVDFTPVSSGDWSKARDEARVTLRLPSEAKVIGWVGRFEAQKDPLVLAEVIERALVRNSDRRAVLVGDGAYRGDVQRRLVAAGLGERVLLTGSRPDVRRLYPAFDVLLHTSRWEGHPRVPQEAIAERVPVIMAATAGTREILVDPRAGIAVEPADIGGFTAALDQVLEGRATKPPLPGDVVDAVARLNGRSAAVPRQRALYESLLVR